MAKKTTKKTAKKAPRKTSKKSKPAGRKKAPSKKKSRTAKSKSTAEQRSAAQQSYAIHLVTTSTGDLLYRLASIAATQFSGVDFTLVPHRLKTDLEMLEESLASIDGGNAIVVHAVADSAAKQVVRATCVQRRIPHFDATGPLMDFLADCVGALPDNDVGRLHRVDAQYQQRIAAMEFTIQHDDGLGLETLAEADVILVGLSRVSKSPTSLYLGSRGYKTANVSITPQTGFPKELARLKKRIVALTMTPQKLQEIRTARMSDFGAPGTSYENLSDVIREVIEAETIYRKRKYPIVDVTQLTIEQTAAKALDALGLS